MFCSLIGLRKRKHFGSGLFQRACLLCLVCFSLGVSDLSFCFLGLSVFVFHSVCWFVKAWFLVFVCVSSLLATKHQNKGDPTCPFQHLSTGTLPL